MKIGHFSMTMREISYLYGHELESHSLVVVSVIDCNMQSAGRGFVMWNINSGDFISSKEVQAFFDVLLAERTGDIHR